MEIARKEMTDVVKSMNEDIKETKTSLAQEATKLETTIEAKLVDSVGKEEVFSCVRDLREEVVGISNEANKAVEKNFNLLAEELEIEKRKNNLIFFGIKENGLCPTMMLLMKFKGRIKIRQFTTCRGSVESRSILQ